MKIIVSNLKKSKYLKADNYIILKLWEYWNTTKEIKITKVSFKSYVKYTNSKCWKKLFLALKTSKRSWIFFQKTVDTVQCK